MVKREKGAVTVLAVEPAIPPHNSCFMAALCVGGGLFVLLLLEALETDASDEDEFSLLMMVAIVCFEQYKGS